MYFLKIKSFSPLFKAWRRLITLKAMKNRLESSSSIICASLQLQLTVHMKIPVMQCY